MENSNFYPLKNKKYSEKDFSLGVLLSAALIATIH